MRTNSSKTIKAGKSQCKLSQLLLFKQLLNTKVEHSTSEHPFAQPCSTRGWKPLQDCSMVEHLSSLLKVGLFELRKSLRILLFNAQNYYFFVCRCNNIRTDHRKTVSRPWKIAHFMCQPYPWTIYGQSYTVAVQQNNSIGAAPTIKITLFPVCFIFL